MSDAVLAIDFGTTTSCAALASDGRVRLLREPVSGSWGWPSSVLVEGNVPRVGTIAEERKRLNPAAYRSEIKRFLGQSQPVQLDGRGHAIVVLVVLMLQGIRAEAERINGGPVPRAVLTVPASYGADDPRTKDLRDAAWKAGIDGAEFLPEPVAAAHAPRTGPEVPPGRCLLVYDLGGGTFDTAVVRLSATGRHEVLGHAALDDCGGRDLDTGIRAELRRAGGAALEALLTDPSDGEDPASEARALRHRLDLGVLARRMKHRLSADEVADELFGHDDLPLRYDRQALRALAAPLLDRAADCCTRLIRSCGVSRDELAGAVMTGGTTRLPFVAEHLRNALRLPVWQAEDPDTAVAHGAALWAMGR